MLSGSVHCHHHFSWKLLRRMSNPYSLMVPHLMQRESRLTSSGVPCNIFCGIRNALFRTNFRLNVFASSFS
jgi:hypothetical protein